MSHDDDRSQRSPWAPWWVYLLVILPANWLRAALMPNDLPPFATAGTAVLTAGVLFVVVTALSRSRRQA